MLVMALCQRHFLHRLPTHGNPSRHAPGYQKYQADHSTKQDCASPTTLTVRCLGSSRPFIIFSGNHPVLGVFFLLQKRQL
jgi:hypothetical protein